MECANLILEGHARVLDTPIDTLKDFVGKFNEAIMTRFRELHGEKVEYTADVTEVVKDGFDFLSMQWEVKARHETSNGFARYNLANGELMLA